MSVFLAPGDMVRFFKQVDTDELDSCWLWIGYRNKEGLGKLSINGDSHDVRYIISRIEGRDVTESTTYANTCGNSRCINVDHIETFVASSRGEETSPSPAAPSSSAAA